MKLLVCASEYYPFGSGIANVAYNVVECLKKEGVQCTVCSPTGPDIELKIKKGYGRISLINYWLRVYGEFESKITDYDVVWLHNPLFIKDNPFDCPFITMHITSYGVYNRVRSSKCYTPTLRIYKNISKYIEKYCMDKLDLSNTHFSAISQQVLDELISLHIPREKIYYIPNGVNTILFKPLPKALKTQLRKTLNLNEQSLIMLCVGNLNTVKNHARLLYIYSIVEKHIPNLFLLIVGDGILRETLLKISNSLGIKSIRFVGHIDYSDISKYYSCSDVFIMPSIYEGLPLTLLEALSSGLPCIVSNVSSMVSMVNEAKAGIAIDFNDEANAVSDIVMFLNDDLINYGENARIYAVRNLDWTIIARKYMDAFSG